ncbi:MAG: cytochrome d ubiquinol oxidase subunit II [Myxococcaceae bacterium]|nr:cytochrome d ubiquinol oxidase subunit II [Myxococcaceae bacterium]MBH2006224.1 cytochrome d ubiquinol oxidase subunit II [Myxococcaceae bacterium]
MWTPEYLLAAVLWIALCIYMLTAGADFGGGILDLLSFGPHRAEKRKLIANQIAPIWESNHIWLIIIVVLLFVCFPLVFETISIVLHIPLTLVLVGIILRGCSFIFRAYDLPNSQTQKTWGFIFGIASLLTPFMLGICLATIASGQIPTLPSPTFIDGSWGTSRQIIDQDFYFYFIGPWLQKFPVIIGFLTLSLCGLLSSLYLVLRANSEKLKNDFRKFGILFEVLTAVSLLIAIFTSRTDAPRLHEALLYEDWSLALQALTFLSAIVLFSALRKGYDRVAQLAGISQVLLVLLGWALGQFPYLIVDTHTILDSAASRAILNPVLIALGVGACALIPSFIWLYRLFSPTKPV